jgi:hypothetical protein
VYVREMKKKWSKEEKKERGSGNEGRKTGRNEVTLRQNDKITIANLTFA